MRVWTVDERRPNEPLVPWGLFASPNLARDAFKSRAKSLVGPWRRPWPIIIRVYTELVNDLIELIVEVEYGYNHDSVTLAGVYVQGSIELPALTEADWRGARDAALHLTRVFNRQGYHVEETAENEWTLTKVDH